MLLQHFFSAFKKFKGHPTQSWYLWMYLLSVFSCIDSPTLLVLEGKVNTCFLHIFSVSLTVYTSFLVLLLSLFPTKESPYLFCIEKLFQDHRPCLTLRFSKDVIRVYNIFIQSCAITSVTVTKYRVVNFLWNLFSVPAIFLAWSWSEALISNTVHRF